MEVHRLAVGKPLLCTDDATIVAVATDDDLDGLSVPVLDLDNVKSIADFIIGQVGLEARAPEKEVRDGAA